MTSREHARFSLGPSAGSRRSSRSPTTACTGRQKEMAAGRHGLGFIGTLTARSFDEAPLRRSAQLQRRSVLGLDGWTTLDRAGVWVVSGWGGLSRVERHSGADPDPSGGLGSLLPASRRRHISAWTPLPRRCPAMPPGSRSTNRRATGCSTRRLGWSIRGFEVNDLGFQFRSDQINSHLMFGHKWTRPSRLVPQLAPQLGRVSGATTIGGDVTWTGLFLTGLYELRNFSTGQWFVAYNPRTLSDRRTRGGPLMVNQPGVEWDFSSTPIPTSDGSMASGLHGNHYQQDGSRAGAPGGPRVEAGSTTVAPSRAPDRADRNVGPVRGHLR